MTTHHDLISLAIDSVGLSSVNSVIFFSSNHKRRREGHPEGYCYKSKLSEEKNYTPHLCKSLSSRTIKSL